MSNEFQNTRKFVRELGNLQDFVDHVRMVEKETGPARSWSDFHRTAGGARYLMVRKGSTPIIDFRHLFAAMSQRLEGSRISNPNFRGEGAVLMLGMGNEVGQCVDELTKWKLNSCFSPEDLPSNRLGAEFAEFVIIKNAENSFQSMADLLNRFLLPLEPLPAHSTGQLKTASYTNNFGEVIRQVFISVSNFIIPKAY